MAASAPLVALGVALALLLLPPGAAAATTIPEDFFLTAADSSIVMRFGRSVSLSGDKVLVGAFQDDEASAGSNAGSVYSFSTPDGGLSWVEEDEFFAPDAADFDSFGYAVALHGDLALVGARLHDTVSNDEGAAYSYVYSLGSWSFTAKITASDPVASDYYGDVVAILAHSNGVVVGAIGSQTNDEAGISSGAVYTYVSDTTLLTWTNEVKLTGTAINSGDLFGNSLSLTQKGGKFTLAVGSEGAANGAGRVFIFRSLDGLAWTETDILVPSDDALGNLFGSWVDIDDKFAIVGASGHSSDTGAAYIFRTLDGGDTYSQTSMLTASSGLAGDNLGHAVAISGDYAAAGAPTGLSFTGYVSIFARTGGSSWTETHVLTASQAVTNARHGFSVTLDDGLLVSGARYATGGNTESGAAFVVRVAAAGLAGDPRLVDFHGHRFVGGHTANTAFRLLEYGSDQLIVHTGTAMGNEHGFFVVAVTVVRAGCGTASLRAVHGTRDIDLSGDDCIVSSIAAGDNGFVLVALGPASDAIVAVVAHASPSFTFLNVKVITATTAFRAGCTGMLCDEVHDDEPMILQ